MISPSFHSLLTLLFWLLTCLAAEAQTNSTASSAPDIIQERLKALEESIRLVDEKLAKGIDDLMWFRRLEELAVIDKVRYTGPPSGVTNNPTAQGAGNPVIILQNLGLREAWHYAVAIGYDYDWGKLYLRSGTTQRQVMPFAINAAT